jgi:hypothetical protein
VRFQLAASNGLFPYPTRLRVKVWEDKLAAMLEQRTQEPLISRSRARLFLGQNDNIGSFIGCFCQVFRQPATFSFFRTRPRLCEVPGFQLALLFASPGKFSKIAFQPECCHPVELPPREPIGHGSGHANVPPLCQSFNWPRPSGRTGVNTVLEMGENQAEKRSRHLRQTDLQRLRIASNDKGIA